MMDITPIEQQLRRAMTPSPCFASDWGPVFGPRIPHRFVMPMVGKQRGGRRRKSPEGENREGHGGEGEEKKEADENNGNKDKR